MSSQTYTVKPGDNLTKIARNFGTTVNEIASLNNITNVNLIRVGQVLRIPGGGSSSSSSSGGSGGATSISSNGIELIKQFEGCRLEAYYDSYGEVWTIGYGHTEGVKKGQRITQAQADEFLRSDCGWAQEAVRKYNSKYHWSQNQFDALVSFTYNLGEGNLNTLTGNGSKTIKQISDAIPLYNKAGGKVLTGLVNRRSKEKELFDK